MSDNPADIQLRDDLVRVSGLFFQVDGFSTLGSGTNLNLGATVNGPLDIKDSTEMTGGRKGGLRVECSIDGGEVTSYGRVAGYSFADRTKDAERWVWYAQDGNARLYKDGVGDVMTFSNHLTGLGKSWVLRSETVSARIVAGDTDTLRRSGWDTQPLSVPRAQALLTALNPIMQLDPTSSRPEVKGITFANPVPDLLGVDFGVDGFGAGAIDLTRTLAVLTRVVQQQQADIADLRAAQGPQTPKH